MKTKGIKRLQLSKKAIANLNEKGASKVKGGISQVGCQIPPTVPYSLLCPSHSICPPGQYCF